MMVACQHRLMTTRVWVGGMVIHGHFSVDAQDGLQRQLLLWQVWYNRHIPRDMVHYMKTINMTFVLP